VENDETNSDYSAREYLYNHLMERALSEAIARLGLHPG
jgi:hypothetical protein